MIQIDDLTDDQCRKLEELGFTVGVNAATKISPSTSGESLYVWYPSAADIAVTDAPGKFFAEVRKTANVVSWQSFDDPISAAVFLLTCV